MAIAVISGTGLYQFDCLEEREELMMATPYGMVTVSRCQLGEEEIYFLPRHGKDHSLAPHMINYRGNICALAKLGVREILAFCSVGGMTQELGPGSLVLLDQFIDMTWGRDHSFVIAGSVGHVEMSHPYCPRLSQELLAVSDAQELGLRQGGVYVCTQGPRFETPAEIRAFASWGANVVGMTGVPEVSLAREAGLCYASVAVVANYAAGLTSYIDGDDVTEQTRKQSGRLERLLTSWVQSRPDTQCHCREAMLSVCKKW